MRTRLVCTSVVALLFCMDALSDETHLQENSLVLKSVNTFLQSINTNDLALMGEVTRHDSMTYTRIEGSDGTWSTRARPQSYFLAPARKNDPQVHERIWDPKVLATDQIAMVWAPYDFYVEGKFSHCGIDLFSLIMENGDWKIANSSWTVQRTGCEKSPLGPLTQ